MDSGTGQGLHGPEKAAEMQRFRRALEGLLGIAATDGNHIDILRNGDEIFPAMLGAIGEARSTIDFLTFVYWVGEIGEEWARALADRAKDGVRVRVLLDALGAYDIEPRLIDLMEKSRVQVERFRPVDRLRFWETDHRTHRKVLICDEDVAFTGGVGIADEWRGDARNPSEWRDTHFRVRGPAVCGLRGAFVQNWAESGHPLFEDGVDRFPEQPTDGPASIQVLRGSSGAGWSDMSSLFRALLKLAEERVHITTAYFVPDEQTSDLLCETAGRGVDVQVLVPGPHIDKRFVQLASDAQIEPLLEAGVKLWSYQPTMLHANTMTVDGLVANVGSANFDARSLLRDEEVNMVVFDRDFTAALERDFAADVARSEPFDHEQWAHRGPAQRVQEAAMGVFENRM